jgi:hypothetical protein
MGRVKLSAEVHALAAACAVLAIALDRGHTRAEEPAPLGRTALFGAYAAGLPYSDAALLKLESKAKLGTEVDIASGFIDWNYILGEPRDLKLADGGRRRLLYSWEPHGDARDHCIGFSDVSAGRADPYLERVAESMKSFPYDIYVRPWAEMNAYWSPYQPGSGQPCAGSVDEFRQAWRYLYDFFRQRGVRNLRFVFNPDVSDDPRNVPIAALWPGNDPSDAHGYVDVLGLDGYNWGDSGEPGGKTWLEFDEIFRDAYRALTQLDPLAPVWICEFGAKEPGENDGTATSRAPRDPAHSKARWIENMIASTAFPRIEALAYYSSYTPNYDNERDFRVDSSRESLAAFRKYLRSRQHHVDPRAIELENHVRRRPSAHTAKLTPGAHPNLSAARQRSPHT